MNTSAIITLVLVWGVVISLTVFFFIKILRAKK
ncbi:hypothetical protein SAMN05216323_101625 [Williamwhitmania taraxaci]|uniref:MetS family NSS transporter small subunit n=1 Tax=Williamwhitmania taraxaci TaxID=1640674 RepID=A0A1G6IJI6_9BACT|nr:hypothetical protein SAMN05216323_101625 [Williamwhitmania taraxaci]